jgi:hypothetical protein
MMLAMNLLPLLAGFPSEKLGIMTFDKSGKHRRVFVEIPFFDCPC